MTEKSNRLALKAGTWYIFSNFLIKAVAVLSTPIITRILTPADYGIAATYLSIFNIITIIGTLDLYSSVQIASFDFEENEMNRFMSSILSLSSISLLILFLIVQIFKDFSMSIIGLDNNLIIFLFINVLLTNAYTLLQTKHRAELKYKNFVFLSIVVSTTSPILSILFINMMDNYKYFGRILGNALPQLLISIVIFIYIIFKGKEFYNKGYWKYALNISLPLIPHHLSAGILSQSDRIMINNLIGSFEVGLYSLSYSYATILNVLFTSFNQAWVPWFYGKMKNQEYLEIKKIVKPYTILFSIIYFSMVVVGPEALMIFGPENYWDGKWIIPPVLLGIYFQFLYSLYVNIEFYLKKTKYIAIGTAIAAIVNLILNHIFIPIFGYISAGYTTLIGYLILFFLHYQITKRWIKIDIIGINFLLKWVVFVITITLIIAFLYPFPLIRYCVFAVVILGIIGFNYKNIVKLVKIFVKK